MKDLEKQLVLRTDDGKEIKAEILFTHHSEEFNKDYVVFLPEGDEQYSAASYVEEGPMEGELSPVESDEEWELLEDLLNDYFQNNDSEEE